MHVHHKVVIVGSGFSGLCMGIFLKQAGIHDFVILEKSSDLGGTWRENTYPGAECDIPSALYSYSFEHNAEWEYKWSGQEQILKYQHDTANKHKLAPHFRFNQELISATFNQALCHWELVTSKQEQITAQHLISAVGQLHHPFTPDIESANEYQGFTFHSAAWQHDVDLQAKRVAVIGNAASAVQFIPKIAEQVAHLTVFQRSANWVLPKLDRPYTRFEQWLSAKVPPITKLYRLNLWLKGELGILPAIRGNRFSRYLLRAWNQYSMKKAINDPELRAKLTPDYPIGAKRILFIDEYYSTLAKDHVSLQTAAIKRFTKTGIERQDGISEDFDVIIYATGFKTNPFLSPIQITGVEGTALSSHWRDGAHAYLGVNTHGFPNLHMLYGPNTNLGHNSIIIMIEAQAAYIVQAINAQQDGALDVRQDVEHAYNQELQSRLEKMAFNEVAKSWYLDGGKITNNWAGGTLEYKRRLRQFNKSRYRSLLPTA